MEKKCLGKYKGKDLYLVILNYANNNRIYVGVETKEGTIMDITTNLPDMFLLSDKCAFLKGDISKDLKKFIKKKGIIVDSIGTYKYNLGSYEQVVLNHDLLKEYSPDEYKRYESIKSKNKRKKDKPQLYR